MTDIVARTGFGILLCLLDYVRRIIVSAKSTHAFESYPSGVDRRCRVKHGVANWPYGGEAQCPGRAA